MVMASSSTQNAFVPHDDWTLKLCSRIDLSPSLLLYVLLAVMQKNMGYMRVHFQTGGSSFWCTEEGGIHYDLGTEEASLGGDMK